MDDAELFSSATAPDAPAEEPVAEAPAEQPAEPEAPIERLRDERGRFVAQQEETPAEQPAPVEAPPPAQPPKDDESQVPSWRLREIREDRDAQARRATEYEQELARTRYMAQQFQRELDALRNPPKVPDLYADDGGKGFVEHNVRQALNPVQSEIGQMREFYSRKDAVREFGAEAVNAAYDAMGKALNAGDPDANAAYRQAMSSMDPYYGIMRWHMQRSVISEAGYDLNAWFDKTLETRLADKAFTSKLMERVRGTAPPANAQGQPNIDLPPSLNRAPGSGGTQGSAADAGDMSDRSLFRYAAAPGRR